MTMDVQNNYRNYRETAPDADLADLSVESARTSPSRGKESTVSNKSKRSFDVAFLMMPDERVRRDPPERRLRLSERMFDDDRWDSANAAERLSDVYKSPDHVDDDTTDVKDSDTERSYYDDRVRGDDDVSPDCGSDVNIDVGTDEYPGADSDSSRSRPDSNESATRRPRFLPESPYKNKIFDDPTLISSQTRARHERGSRYCSERPPDLSPKSAFTKVANYAHGSPSVSPDNLFYQNSISPPPSAVSPPTSSPASRAPAFNNSLPPAHLLNGANFFKGHDASSGSPNFGDAGSTPRVRRSNIAYNKNIEYEKQDTKLSPNKMNFLPFRPEFPPYLRAGSSYPFSVQTFQTPDSELMKFPVTVSREPVSPLMANPAAAILSTLLPPTLAAFSLPAQNVCAKCSISFRMTSDLVYHMRTHHKSESTADPNRRKREEKLKCPVCDESFRERHHLTRHMTAHQDKEGDSDDAPHTSHSFNKKSKPYYNGSLVHK